MVYIHSWPGLGLYLNEDSLVRNKGDQTGSNTKTLAWAYRVDGWASGFAWPSSFLCNLFVLSNPCQLTKAAPMGVRPSSDWDLRKASLHYCQFATAFNYVESESIISASGRVSILFPRWLWATTLPAVPGLTSCKPPRSRLMYGSVDLYGILPWPKPAFQLHSWYMADSFLFPQWII